MSRQKLSSYIEIPIGDITSKALKIVPVNLISLVAGSLELKQIVRYQTQSDESTYAIGSDAKTKSAPVQYNGSHNITIEYIEKAIAKSKSETIIIPCKEEFIFTGQFYSLNKDPLERAMKYEDFLFQIEIEIKSVDIDILDMCLISDYNITEKPYGKLKKKCQKSFRPGHKVYDIRLLRAEQNSFEWINRSDYQQIINKNISPKFLHLQNLTHNECPIVKNASSSSFEISSKNQNFKSIGSSTNSCLFEDLKVQTNAVNTTVDGNSNHGNTSESGHDDIIQGPRITYNHSMDAFYMIDTRKGFLSAKGILDDKHFGNNL